MGRHSSDDDDDDRDRRGRKDSDNEDDRSSRKKRKDRDDDSDDDDSDDTDNSKDRSRKKKSKKKSKKEKKKRETSAERQLRRLEKQQLKKELEAQKEAQVAAQMAASLGYSNKDNPFGDSNLSQKFVWVKKREQEMKNGITAPERLKRDSARKQEVQMELEKLNKLRAEREIEMQLREQEQMRLRREQDQAQLGDWEKREDQFHFKQAKSRAKIRIAEGRAKPIDILAMNISMATDSELAQEFEGMGLEMDTEEPYLIFQNLVLSEVEELHKDIQMYMTLEQDESNQAFWKSMLIVCDDELNTQRALTKNGGRRNPVADAVNEEITNMLSGKTYEQLVKIQSQVERRLSGEDKYDGPLDVEYWEAVMKALLVWRAKAKLKNMHKFLLTKRLEQLKARGEEAPAASSSKDKGKAAVRLGRSLLASSSASAESAEKAARALKELESLVDMDDEDAGLRASEEAAQAYDGSMSPLITDEIMREDRHWEVVEEEEDYEALLSHRRRVLKGGKEAATEEEPTAFIPEDDRFRNVKEEDLEEDEEAFNDEANIDKKTAYLWADKYRPRKPRYFNRVHTGYEWNKYNQTHYDSDNPPPKVVQGYKFNIFYPDLIDKSKTPTYKIERDQGFPDTVILRFIASAPYEDIAFRVVNRELEYSHKKGFRSSFDRGVLQLHFHFKRQYYRR